MKTLTKLFAFLMLFNISNSFGQERINREIINFDKSSKTISKTIGWSYNTTSGEWINNKNVILNYKNASWMGEYQRGTTKQNFEKIQTKTFNFKGKTYFVLMIEQWTGQYRYPNIRRDWYVYKEIIGFIYTEQEYQKLINIDTLVELKTKYKVNLGKKYDEIKILSLIQTELEEEKLEYYNTYIFPIMKSKEGNILFYLPDTFIYPKYNFKEAYFETDINNFNNIIDFTTKGDKNSIKDISSNKNTSAIIAIPTGIILGLLMVFLIL